MSTTIITIEEVSSVEHHPNADRLDIITVLGYQVVTGRGQYKVGDHVFYFPPDILIPPKFSEVLGVQKYLKHAMMDGEKIQCRVGAARLRGMASYGFVSSVDHSPQPLEAYDLGQDVTDWFEGEKYVPPVRVGAGDAAPECPNFHRYTNIENYQRYPNRIPNRTNVVITEKIHGTNCRMGLVQDDSGELVFMAGSNRVPRREGLYWQFMTENVKEFLECVSRGYRSVVLFGEIYGPGVQDMHYGETEKQFRAFDCAVDGRYMDRGEFWSYCSIYNIETVPVLYSGPFYDRKIAEYTDGGSTLLHKDAACKFKGREGIVITPLMENFDGGARMILKSVSVDYLERKGAQDNE